MNRARLVVLVVWGTLAACAGSAGTQSIEEDAGYGPTRIDAGKKDAAKGDSAVGPDSDVVVEIDAGKKDSGLKDVGTPDVVIADVAQPDVAPPPDAGPDAFVDAGPPSTTLVINEIDYDQPVNDDAEFVEIYNRSAGAVDLTNLALAFFNGTTAGQASTEYLRIDLGPGSLGPGQYLLVRASAGVADAGGASVVINFNAVKNNVQNGERDSIIIVNKVSNAVIDAVTYEPLVGSGAPFNGTYTLVEGHATTAADLETAVGALVRSPTSVDTNDNDADFKFTTTPTPGRANVITP